MLIVVAPFNRFIRVFLKFSMPKARINQVSTLKNFSSSSLMAKQDKLECLSFTSFLFRVSQAVSKDEAYPGGVPYCSPFNKYAPGPIVKTFYECSL